MEDPAAVHLADWREASCNPCTLSRLHSEYTWTASTINRLPERAFILLVCAESRWTPIPPGFSLACSPHRPRTSGSERSKGVPRLSLSLSLSLKREREREEGERSIQRVQAAFTSRYNDVAGESSFEIPGVPEQRLNLQRMVA